MTKIVYESQLVDLVDSLSEESPVFVPTENDLNSFTGQYKFSGYKKGSSIVFRYPFTVLPPTEFILPPKEVLFSFFEGQIVESEFKEQVIFGLSLEDLKAISQLREVFESSPKDRLFSARIEKTTLVAIDKFSPPKEVLYDLYLQEIETGAFLAFTGSKKGKKILEKPFFKESEKPFPKILPANDIILGNPKLPMAIKKSKNHHIWDELSSICFGCGICSYVCPLCYCYDVTDEVGPKKNEGKRLRSWDSCMLASFTDSSAGNFRPELRDRIYNWYFHKFVRMPKEFGFSGCINCNRCTLYCPAKISYKRTLKIVLDDYEKKERV